MVVHCSARPAVCSGQDSDDARGDSPAARLAQGREIRPFPTQSATPVIGTGLASGMGVRETEDAMFNRLGLIFLMLAAIAASAAGGFFVARQTAAAPEATEASQPDPQVEVPAANVPGEASGDDSAPLRNVERSEPQRAERPPDRPRPAAERQSVEAGAPAQFARVVAPPAVPALSDVQTGRVEGSGPPAPPAQALPDPVPLPDVIADRVEPPLPPPAPEPPAPVATELVVDADSVIGLRITGRVSSEDARIEDNVDARITRDVRVGGEVAIPSGTRARGSVTLVESGGRFKERARIGIRFHTLEFADGTERPISTDTLFRVGDAPGNSTAAKVGGGAVVGAILGAILGGSKGAAIGAASGAGAGTAAVMAGDRSEAVFPAGTEVTARLLAPLAVVVEP